METVLTFHAQPNSFDDNFKVLTDIHCIHELLLQCAGHSV